MLRFEGDVFRLGTAILAPIPFRKVHDARTKTFSVDHQPWRGAFAEGSPPNVSSAGNPSAAAYSDFACSCKRGLRVQAAPILQESPP
jgi:hypothetical protein